MNWFTSSRTGTVLEGLNEIAHLSHDKRIQMCQICYGDYGLEVKLLALVHGYQHFRGNGCRHCQGGY